MASLVRSRGPRRHCDRRSILATCSSRRIIMRPWKKTLVAGGLLCGGAYLLRAAARRKNWFSFAGRVVLVTGGSRGLGLAMARKLAQAGAKVAICARTE